MLVISVYFSSLPFPLHRSGPLAFLDDCSGLLAGLSFSDLSLCLPSLLKFIPYSILRVVSQKILDHTTPLLKNFNGFLLALDKAFLTGL